MNRFLTALAFAFVAASVTTISALLLILAVQWVMK